MTLLEYLSVIAVHAGAVLLGAFAALLVIAAVHDLFVGPRARRRS